MSEQTAITHSTKSDRPWLWQPGRSANPGGRKAAVDLPALCREHGPRGVEICAKLMESADERIALAAVIALWDRGFGKPVQAVTSTDDVASFTFLHLTAMRAFSDELNKHRDIDGVSTSVDTHTNVSTPRNLMEPATE